MLNAEVKAEGERGRTRPKWALANFEIIFPLYPSKFTSAFRIQNY
jgi:hypothetical protein